MSEISGNICFRPEESPHPLPGLIGPKLEPFATQHDVQVIRCLSSKTPGKHSHVFEVEIAGERYALKIFRFYNSEELLPLADLYNVTLDNLILQMDPAYAEYRAYGCISDNGLNGKVAVHCHGYMTVPAVLEADLEKEFNISDWNRPEEEYDFPASERQPFRAIVKSLVLDGVSFTEEMIPQMKKDLFILRRVFVYVRDVRKENYLGGKLVDFSCAWTAPHIFVSTYTRFQNTIDSDLHWDLEQFDQMIEEAGYQSWCRATPNPAYLLKLRSHKSA